MSPETDAERTDRIRNAQIRDRNPAALQHPNHVVKKKHVTKVQGKSLRADLLDMLPGGVRDVAVGLGYGLIPAILAALFLPAAFKLLGVLVLAVAATAGYMLGKADA